MFFVNNLTKWQKQMSDNYITAQEIANIIEGIVIGNPEEKLYGIRLIDECTDGFLTYIRNAGDIMKLDEIRAGAVIINPCAFLPVDRTYIVVSCNVCEKLYKVVQYFVDKGVSPEKIPEVSNYISDSAIIYKNAIIEENCYIGKNTVIHSGAVIERDVFIGDNCVICANAVVHRGVTIGNNTHVGSGSIIGCDGFEVYSDNGVFHVVQTIGGCIIGNNVMINSNTVIQRGTIGDTVINNGTVIGSQVTIGHEVKIGNNCKIVSTAGIAGWAVIGDNVQIYAQAAIDNVNIGNNACVMAKSGVTKDIDTGCIISGYPAQNHMNELKYQAYLRKKFRKGS